MVGMRKRDVHQFANRNVFKPRELIKGHEELSLLKKQPEAML